MRFLFAVVIATFTLLSSPCHVNGKSIAKDSSDFIVVPLRTPNVTLGSLLGPQSFDCSTRDDLEMQKILRQSKNGLIDPRYRWNEFRVYPDPVYSQAERDMFFEALVHIKSAIPCVNILYYGGRPTEDHVYISPGSGCSSAVGRQGGAQGLSLARPGCMHLSVAIHELIHALGFFHEQSRPDRDNYVNIFWQNIEAGKGHNFDKLGDHYVTTFGVPYNTRSIMHYGSRDFSANGQPTILAKNGGDVGSVGQMQSTDIDKLRRMYNC